MANRWHLCETMGDDLAIVQAARVSFGQGTKGEERDRRLIKYLLRHDHGTPFEMVVFRFTAQVTEETAWQLSAHPHISAVCRKERRDVWQVVGTFNARTALEIISDETLKASALARAARAFLQKSCPWTYQAWHELRKEEGSVQRSSTPSKKR